MHAHGCITLRGRRAQGANLVVTQKRESEVVLIQLS